MSEVLVIGHRNPDTDAICSAIGYAEFKRRTGMPEAVAARCGDTNDRINFVLRHFGMTPPRFVSDVSPKISDVMRTDVISVEPQTTVAQALSIMDKGRLRVLPVLQPDGKCAGLVSMFKLSRVFVPSGGSETDSRRLLTSLNGLVETLGGKCLHGKRQGEEEELTMVIGAMSDKAFASRLEKYHADRLVVIVGDRWDIQNLAIREKARCLIVTGGLSLEDRTLEAAKEAGVSVILSPHDTATTANLCRTAMPVRHILRTEYLTFPRDMRLELAQRQAAETSLHAFPVVDKEDRMVGFLSKSDFLKPIDRRLILVDHNELSQAVKGADKVDVIEIIDHHRVGAFSTSQPILFRNEPVGSTSTIVADSFFRYGVELPEKIAGLLLAGLVSDTLNLTSPTATSRDADVLKKLEEISGVSARDFTEKLFASGSVLTSKAADEAITTDCKEYEEDGKKFSVAQIEEIGFDQFEKRKSEVKDALEKYRAENGYYFSSLLVTDVVRQNSLLVLTGAESMLAQVKYPELEPGVYDFHGVVSRKKQLMPFLSRCLENVSD